MALPRGATIGPYRIEEPLGRGGMGVVYRAIPAGGGAAVALKTIDVPDAALATGIRREIGALARLSHPGIVAVVDHGVAESGPWYAMELLEGTMLHHHAERLAGRSSGSVPTIRFRGRAAGKSAPENWWTELLPRPARAAPAATASRPPAGPERSAAAGGALPEVLTLVRRLCAPLAYLHGEGIVHRDLKPGNVLVRRDGTPVLIDFGLATATGGEASRERMAPEIESVGTAAYVAPEQAAGDLVDARADIYALGCVLYELVTGRTPFSGGTPQDVLLRRFSEEPAPASSVVDGVPPMLDALLLRMLARDPRRRIGYAEDVARVLAALGAADGLATSGPAPRLYLYRPGLQGRARELDDVAPVLERLAEGTGGMLLLQGESGVGKTRLALAIARRAAEMGLGLHVGECAPPPSVPVPLHPWRPLLQHVADRCRSDPASRDQLLGPGGRFAEVLADHEPSLQAFLPKRRRTRVAAPKRGLLEVELERVLAAVGRERPSVVLLDDLQWADELTLDVLEALARGTRLARAAILVVGTRRSEEPCASVDRITSVHPEWSVALGRLDRDAIGGLVADMLALESPSDDLVSVLASRSEGNPFLAAEYLRAAVEEGLLVRDHAGVWELRAEAPAIPALPRRVGELLERRLRGLTAVALRLARQASVLGREVDAGIVAACDPAAEVDVLEGMRLLLTRQVMEEPAPGRLRFAHDKLREAVLAGLPAGDVAELQRRGASVLAARGRPEDDAEIGRLWEAAGEAERARPHYLRSGRAAMEGNALARAEELLGAYLRLAAEGDTEAVAVRLDFAGRVLIPRGRADRALAEADGALSGGPGAGVLARAWHVRGMALEALGRWTDAEVSYGESLASARRAADATAEAAALIGLGVVAWRRSDLPVARERYLEALAIHRRLGELGPAGSVAMNLALLETDLGNRAEARRLYGEALAAARSEGDGPREAEVLANLANLDTTEGRRAEARASYEKALQAARDAGDRRFEATMLGALGIVHQDDGDLDEATRLQRQALALSREIGDEGEEASTLGCLARIALARGGLHEAGELVAQSTAIYLRLGNRRFAAYALAQQGEISRQAGDLAAARQSLERAIAELDAIGDRWLAGAVREELGAVAIAEGSLGDAEAIYRDALAAHEEVGNPRSQGTALLGLARARRLAGAPFADEVERAATLLAERGDAGERARVEAELGHVALRAGRDASGHLDAAVRLGEEIGAGPESTVGSAVDELRQAMERRGGGRSA